MSGKRNLEGELAEGAADVVSCHLGHVQGEECAEGRDGALAQHLKLVPGVAWVGYVHALEEPLGRIHSLRVAAGELRRQAQQSAKTISKGCSNKKECWLAFANICFVCIFLTC